MVKKCCVYTCPSESYSGCGISFFSFPKNEEIRLKWLSSIHVKQKITKNSVVCSRHFEPSCFYSANSRLLLKDNAIPTISPLAKNKKIEVLSNILLQQPQSVTSEEEILNPFVPLDTLIIAGTSSSNIEEPPRKKLCPNVKEVGVQTAPIKCMSPEVDVLKRKIKILTKRLNRRDERLKNLQSLLFLVKKKCKNYEEVEQNIKNNFNNIHTLLNTEKSHKGRKYSDEVKKFALSLYFYSSKAYLFLRNHICLPHPVTLRKILATHECNVGFIAEVFENLKLSVKEYDLQIFPLSTNAIKNEKLVISTKYE